MAQSINRRGLLWGGVAALAGINSVAAREPSLKNNTSSFRKHHWRHYFDSTENGAILVDITSRVLHFWSEDLALYRIYPTSVPMSDELTRVGRTSIIQKVVNPSWSPTPSMKRSNPEWPDRVAGGAPNNPMGTRAMYLEWTYYRIHGIDDGRKIGRKASNGCIGLFNHHVEDLFSRTKIGTQVLLI